ncbi:MAG: hypothetical protein V4857_26885 [Pseudomonadota bacterium]
MAAQMDSLTCKGCGASLSYAAGLQALQCQYCDALTEIRRPEREVEDAADLVIPLTVDQGGLEQAVLRHLASGDYTPDDLVDKAVLSTLNRCYVPCFQYSGSYEARWTASFGYDSEETYTDYVRRTDNGHTHNEPVTRTRTVTEWRPVSGTDAGVISELGYGGSGLPDRVAQLVEDCPGVRSATGFNVSFVSGVEVQPFSRTEGDTFDLRAEKRINQRIDASVRRHAQGEQQRDWHWKATISKSAVPILVPLCNAVIEYKGKRYNFWIDGTDTSKVVGDHLPTDKGRSLLVGLGYVLPTLATIVLVVPFLVAENFFEVFSWQAVGMTCAVFGLSYWRRRRILSRSREARQTQLARRTQKQDCAGSVAAGPGFDLITLGITLVSMALVGLLIRHANATPEPYRAPAAGSASTARPASALPVPAVAPIATPELAAAPASPADIFAASKRQQFAALLAAANAEDWAAVRTLTGKLKQGASAPKAARAKSKAANARGLKALLQNDSGAAVEAFKAAVLADGANMEARNNLGGAYIRMGDFGAAMEALSELMQAAPEYAKGWRNLSEAAAMVGKPAEADASLRLLLHYAKDRQGTIDALKKRANSMAPDKFSEAASRVLMFADSIPRRP